ncbi:MAG: hypothetical protein US69_C0011G0034 [candidate division TM6 bacterium GW2011_GWF2_38_10]|nr:MAG: hypothetical protein US69_C0011G0034 [candidate division TM6 bacterium GW2011_GWF2_38_10]
MIYKKILLFLFMMNGLNIIQAKHKESMRATIVKERPIVVLVPSYNNKDWAAVNLASIFFQCYTNYRVIYIDDCSTDGTGDIVEAYIKEHKLENKITIIKNKERLFAAANRYFAIHTCRDDEIIVNIDGDDWFSRDDVLSEINAAYSSDEVWLTYGNFINWPSSLLGYGQRYPKNIIDRRAFREHRWVIGQPRTFYAGLFKFIKKEDLMYEGAFVRSGTDVAMMFPLLEMVGNHLKYLGNISYIRNVATDLNIFKTFRDDQKVSSQYYRNKNKYTTFLELPFEVNNNIITYSYKFSITHGSYRCWVAKVVE